MATETVWSKIDRAHQLYRDLKQRDALELYTEALVLAKTKSQKIALHSNRAACYLKLHDFKKVAQECTSVLEWDQQHTGALMLRAQTLVTLKDYPSALFDVNRLMELNPASDVYRNLQARLKTQLSLATIPESEDELMYHGEDAEANTLYKLKRKNMARLISPSEAAITESENHVAPQGWEAIPKPRGHSGLDYSRWDRVEENSSEDEDDEAELQKPQYRFRVRTAGVIRPVK